MGGRSPSPAINIAIISDDDCHHRHQVTCDRHAMQRVGFDTGAPSGVIAFTTVEGGESISRDGIFQSFSLNLPAGRSGTAGMSDEPHANSSLRNKDGPTDEANRYFRLVNNMVCAPSYAEGRRVSERGLCLKGCKIGGAAVTKH